MHFQPRFPSMYRPWHLVLLLSACALALTFFNPDPTATQVASAQEVSGATPEVERLEADTIPAIDPSDEDPPPGEESRDTIPSLVGPTITVVGSDPGAPTRVELQKGICPSDLSRESTLQQLIDACAMSPHGGVTFELIDANGSHTAVTDASGFARFSDVLFRDDGTVQLTESIPTGYGDPVVWCHDQRAGETVRQADDFGSVILDSEASHLGVVPCAFFNFPTADDMEAAGTATLEGVDARKYACPADINRESTFEQFLDACESSPMGGVTFELVDSNGPRPLVTDEVNGLARFHEVVARADGTVQLTESVPLGFGDPVVWCHDQRAEDWVLQADSFGAVVLDSDAATSASLSCYFFNIPEDGDDPEETGIVRVSKYTCPAGYDPTGLDDYLMSEQCREEIAPVEFTVNSGEGWRTTQAAEGTAPLHAEFTLVPIGPVTITESVPAGYGEPLVFCSDTPADGAGNY